MNKTLETDLRGLNKRLDYYEKQLAEKKGDDKFNMSQIGFYQGEAAKVRDALLDTIVPVAETTAAPVTSQQPTRQPSAPAAPGTVGGTAAQRGATVAQTRPGEVL